MMLYYTTNHILPVFTAALISLPLTISLRNICAAVFQIFKKKSNLFQKSVSWGVGTALIARFPI